MPRLAFLFSLLLGFAGCHPQPAAEVPYYNSPNFTPQWFASPEEAAPRIPHVLGDFRLTNQAGDVVTQKSVQGKIHVASFFFTRCPGVCPKLTSAFKTLQTTFASDPDVLLLSFSVMPWADSVAQLRVYAQAQGIRGGKWNLLTGPKAAIYDLARRSYFAEETTGFTKDSSQFLHTEHLVLVDGTGRLRGLYKGTQALDTERLVADIRALRREAEN